MLSEDVWGCIHPILHGAAFPENLDIVAAVIQGLDSLDLQLCFRVSIPTSSGICVTWKSLRAQPPDTLSTSTVCQLFRMFLIGLLIKMIKAHRAEQCKHKDTGTACFFKIFTQEHFRNTYIKIPSIHIYTIQASWTGLEQDKHLRMQQK